MSSTSSSFRRNARWAIGGIGSEFWNNIFVRPLSKILPRKKEVSSNNNRDLAIVTGATGGIGVEICRGLLKRNYDVLLLARNVQKGKELEQTLLQEQQQQQQNRAIFVEYHADQTVSSSFDTIVDAIIKKDRRVSVLVNNAGVMSGTKSETFRINLVAPTLLTIAMLPFFSNKKAVVVNVGSSSHLRALKVQDYSDDDEEIIDTDLSAYAESKLGLMQFSNILRLTTTTTVYDAHPGLVWTPLLKKNFPGAKLFEKFGFNRILYKSPEEGAATILAAVDAGRKKTKGKSSSYYVNRKEGGYASPESKDTVLSKELWNTILGPMVQKTIPVGYKEINDNLVGSEQQQCDDDNDDSP